MPSLINADNGVVSGSVGLKYSTDNTGTLALQTNGNTAVTIDSSSRVGIGTTTPSNPLHIVNSGANINLLNLVGTNSYTSTALGGEGPIRLQNTNTTNGNMSTISNYDGNGNINAQINFINMNHSGTADIAFTTRSGGSYPEKMRIDSGGRMSLPYQPSFYAWSGVGDVAFTTETPLPLNTTFWNTGSHYNTSNYRFTAPVAGKYFFRANIYKQSNGNYSRLRIQKNNTSYTYHLILASGAETLTITSIVEMAVNDFVTCTFNADGGGANIYMASDHTSFSGWFLG
jgi:hypothetical protein